METVAYLDEARKAKKEQAERKAAEKLWLELMACECDKIRAEEDAEWLGGVA